MFSSSNLQNHRRSFWVLFAGFLYTRMISCTNFTIIYDQLFHKQFTSISLPENQSRVNLIQIKTQYDNLQNITASIMNISKADVILLFTKQDDFIANILNDQQLVLKYGISLGNMTKSNTRMENTFCLSLNQTLQRALTMLTYSILQQKVAMITEEGDCAKDFYTRLKTSILTSRHTNLLHVKMIHVVHRKDQPPYQDTQIQHSDLNIIKSLHFRTIILLVTDQYVSIILKEASRIGLLDRNSLWLIPSYHHGMIPLECYPEKLLAFNIRPKGFIANPYSKLNKGINDTIKTYEEMNCHKSRETLSTMMYQIIQKIEEEDHTKKIQLNLWYDYDGQPTEKDFDKVLGEINHDWFYISDRAIQALHRIIEEPNHDHITAVTILDEPYTVDQISFYDSFLDICTIGIKCEKPIMKNGTVSYEQTCCTGFTIDLFALMIKHIGIDVHIYVVEDNSYGAIGPDGKWNGLIGDILDGKADMAIAGLTISESRSEIIDFTLPFLEAEMGIIVKPQVVELPFINFEFISPLSAKLQLMLWIIIVVTIVLNYAFENSIYLTSLTHKYYYKENYYSTYESMTYISGVALQRDLGGKNPKRPGARISAVVYAFGMVIVVTTYTAVLAAQNMQYVEDNPFKGSKDERMRNPTEKFRFGTRKNTNYIRFFRDSEIEFVQRIYEFMKSYNVDTTEEGVRKVKNGTLEAFIGDYQLLYWYISNDRSCELRVQKDILLHPGGYGFAMKKNFKWTTKMNKAVLRFRESKEFGKLYKKWFRNVCQDLATAPKMVQLDINHFGGLILMLCLTAAVCFPVLLPEHIYDKHFKNFTEKRIKRIFKMQSYHLNGKEENNIQPSKMKYPRYEVNRFFEEIKKTEPSESYQDIIRKRKREKALAKFED